MYSRDIFPKYTSGGLPIPENYSGNAIRRVPQGANPSMGNREGGRGSGSNSSMSSPRVHTSPARTSSTRAAEVPLSVTPSFVTRNERRENANTAGDPLHGSMQGEDASREELPREEDGAGDARSESGGDGLRGGTETGSDRREDTSDREREEPAVAVSAQGHSSQSREGGLGSLLSTLLPPKFGGGAISKVGLEEALLLGLFLLLSQSEEEDDTLMLLALLFLYR